MLGGVIHEPNGVLGCGAGTRMADGQCTAAAEGLPPMVPPMVPLTPDAMGIATSMTGAPLPATAVAKGTLPRAVAEREGVAMSKSDGATPAPPARVGSIGSDALRPTAAATAAAAGAAAAGGCNCGADATALSCSARAAPSYAERGRHLGQALAQLVVDRRLTYVLTWRPTRQQARRLPRRRALLTLGRIGLPEAPSPHHSEVRQATHARAGPRPLPPLLLVHLCTQWTVAAPQDAAGARGKVVCEPWRHRRLAASERLGTCFALE